MTTTVPPSPPRARPTAAGRERTLARLVDDIRSLLPVDAVAFVTVDREGGFMERAAGWFATPEL
jgi:hypothetical protein